MKQIVIVMCWLLPLIVSAQEKSSIKFSTACSWNEVLAEAKRENKPIFVDAYATWCVPCKQMDKEVFSRNDVAEYINSNFVSLKVQMDETEKDDANVRQWLKEAEKFKSYVTAYPCYLFFTPDGEYAGQKEGAYAAMDFLAILRNSVDQTNGYLAKIRKFKNSLLGKSQLLNLAYEALQNKDTIATSIARKYKSQYIDRMPIDSLLNPIAARFTATFFTIFASNDLIIKYLYSHPTLADSLFRTVSASASRLSDAVITKDYIEPFTIVKNKAVPNFSNWKSLQRSIAKDYDQQTAKRLVMDGKIAWAFKGERLEDAIRFEFEKIDALGMDTSGFGRAFFNNRMYSIVFKQLDDPKLLKKAVELMKYVTELENRESASHLDTYASLLYKAGEKGKALEVEKTALEMAKEQKNEKNIRLYTEMIDRMQKGEETWKLE